MEEKNKQQTEDTNNEQLNNSDQLINNISMINQSYDGQKFDQLDITKTAEELLLSEDVKKANEIREIKLKQKKNRNKLIILSVFGVVALAIIIGLVFLLAKLVNQ